eukprot:9020354-Prorocentrum_lima.AAC.1
MGLRRLRKEYTPTPYSRKNQRQEHIPMLNITEAAANYLANNHWARPDIAPEAPPDNFILDPGLLFNTEPLSLNELLRAIYRAKSRKAPGPDKITIDIIKLLDDRHLQPILDELNHWYSQANLPDPQSLAQ